MNMKLWVPLGLSVSLGLMAAILAKTAMVSSKSHPGPKAISIVVTRALIGPGQSLTEADLELIAITAKVAPPDAFTDFSALVGRVTAAPMVAGQPFLESLLTPRGTQAGLQALIPKGQRAFTLEVNESNGLSGLLVPGCHVDVVATTPEGQNPDHTLTRAIAQNIQVLAVGPRLTATKPDDKDSNGVPVVMKTVTLLVSPHEAATLEMGSSSSRLRLIMRGSGDTDESDDDGVTLAELRGGLTGGSAIAAIAPQVTPAPATQPADPTAVAEAPARRTVLLIQGNEERRLIFPSEPRFEQPSYSATDTAPAK
jgi:pilus assembly protein CpaB